jgi:hypothetical protein
LQQLPSLRHSVAQTLVGRNLQLFLLGLILKELVVLVFNFGPVWIRAQ